MQKYMLSSIGAFSLCLLFSFFTTTNVSAQIAELFAPGVISDGGVFGLTLSPDGKTAVFVRAYGGRDSLHLFISRLENGNWSTPVRAPFSTLGKNWNDIDPAFSPDGKFLLFNSNRPLAGRPKADFDIWGVKRTQTGWGEAYHLGDVINTDSSDIYATVANSGNIYFSSNRAGGLGKLDLYMSVYRNGAYQSPQNLGAEINTQNHDSNPFISPKEDYLIFWRQDPDGYGASDLYISFRKKNTWTKALNLGPAINTEIGEFCPFIQPKGKKLFFSRTRVNGAVRVENIYSIDFSAKQFRSVQK
ncbi:TolB family protein [Haliscomenobacter hydrossis]|uniref:WD40-like beta Propeller containing protein n=1 Tax=Haliscomenobacter hydrossis (strain ATCC 27775 / DSM 1100 / LMG 10767 / O) TaxID=760192 RepID=F4KS83_HALH1|nr:PD40 domain-containing protein [Haliscomenobacter hydrossis]AEE52328.1 WD40-like beta Propeller containing protein [Haliscomenobacter hydrossis DSM 1100]